MTNLNEVSRFQKSIHPKELVGDKVVNESVIKEVKEYNSSTSILLVDTNKFQKIYLVVSASWGGDCVDVFTHAFIKKEDAEACFAFYNLPMSKLMNQKSYPTAIAETPTGTKHIPCDNYKGFVVRNIYGGELLKPFFSQAIITQNGWQDDEVLKEAELDIRSLIGTPYEAAILRFDENIGGVTVRQEKVVRFFSHHCWETGLTYKEIAFIYPEHVFAAMKPYLEYHNEEIEEEGDWEGWYILENSPNLNKLKSSLETIGWSIVNYEDSTSDDD